MELIRITNRSKEMYIYMAQPTGQKEMITEIERETRP